MVSPHSSLPLCRILKGLLHQTAAWLGYAGLHQLDTIELTLVTNVHFKSNSSSRAGQEALFSFVAFLPIVHMRAEQAMEAFTVGALTVSGSCWHWRCLNGAALPFVLQPRRPGCCLVLGIMRDVWREQRIQGVVNRGHRSRWG